MSFIKENDLPANSNTPPLEDEVLPFQPEGADILGRIIRADAAVSKILEQHDYPESVSELLGEAVLLTALIGSGLKLRGKFTLQIQSDGAINLLAADYSPNGGIRGYAGFDEEKLERWTGGEKINPFLLLGAGHIVITMNNGADESPYQSIVPIEGKSLSAAILKYIERSEQILSSLKLCVRKVKRSQTETGARQAAAALIRKAGKAGEDNRIVADSEQDEAEWNHHALLFKTLTDDELTDRTHTIETIPYRLFHQNGVRVFEKTRIFFYCGCERERFAAFLKSMAKEELQELAEKSEESGKIVTNCRFCNQKRLFSLEELL